MQRRSLTAWLIFVKAWLLLSALLNAAYGQVLDCPDCRRPGLWGQAYIGGSTGSPRNPKADRALDYNARDMPAPRPDAKPRPAIVKVVSYDRDGGNSLGSGALLAVSKEHGLVITNNHVVSDAGERIDVVFADGQRFGAKLLGVDQAFDLAALLIYAPQNIEPLKVAVQNAELHERVTVTGYAGRTQRYREATGSVINFVRPAGTGVFDSPKISVASASGCSGAPVLNARGEVVAVLWGSQPAEGFTAATCCLRLRGFLARYSNRFNPPPKTPEIQPGPVDEGQENSITPPIEGGSNVPPPSDRTDGPIAKLKEQLAKAKADRLALRDKLKSAEADIAALRVPHPEAPEAPLWEGKPVGDVIGGLREQIKELEGRPLPEKIEAVVESPAGKAVGTVIDAKLIALLAGFGVPGWIAAGGLWIAKRRIKKRLDAKWDNASSTTRVINERDVEIPVPQNIFTKTERHNQYVPIQTLDPDKHWLDAMARVAERWPAAASYFDFTHKIVKRLRSGEPASGDIFS